MTRFSSPGRFLLPRTDRRPLACFAPFRAPRLGVLVQRVQRDARLGVDSPAASSPGILGALFSGYSGGRQRFVVDAGGWEVERVQMPGDGWRDAHDYIASTVFDLVSLAGITGTMEPRGIFSMAVPAEVLAAALAEDGSRCSRPGAVPDYCFTVDGRRMLYDVKRISFCPSRYWPTVAVASSRGGPLE